MARLIADLVIMEGKRGLLETIHEIIIKIIRGFPDGASLEEIMQALLSPLPKRTLQRHLALLVKENKLSILGKARAVRYFAISKSKEVEASLIPLSTVALSIQDHVRQPIQARMPVGYKGEFLDQYRPGETYYLPEKVRVHLLEIGKSDGTRPAGTYAKQILNRLLIDLSWNSSRLEGNTYSLLETERLLELGEASAGKDSLEAQMILNHKAAIEFMVESVEHLRFNKFTISNLHALLSDNLISDPLACGGLRQSPVAIAKSVYQPLAIPQLISDYFGQILDTAEAIPDPFEQSFFVMVHLPYLQPFLDVNKRVSRLAANIPLIRDNLCPLSFVDMPEGPYVSGLLGVYELNRIELLREVFVWAYERSSALYSATRGQLGEPDLFRLRHRTLIIETVGEIIRGCLDKQAASLAIKEKALETMQEADRAKFIEVLETQLRSLHKGNIARFKLTLPEYEKWLQTWR